MPHPVRIGNAHGFWGDRLSAAAELLALEPNLDFLTLDFLAEVSMSILALQRSRDPTAGWPRDFLEIIRSIAPYWRDGGRCRVITNAGGLNPGGCAEACREVLDAAGCGDRTIAIVSGDDVLDLIRADDSGSSSLNNSDTGEPLGRVRDRLVTANAYLGSQQLAEALARGADLVITGRVADPSLTVAACVHAFDWPWDAWDRLAGGTVAGHLIECGTQVTGGISTDWLDLPGLGRLGFPIVEVSEDGCCIVTKPRGTGGRVDEMTVKEQLVYEIGDPNGYLSPDATVSFTRLEVEDQGDDRVLVRGARGRPAPRSYKVSATYRDGFRAQGQLTVFGRDAVAKARRAAETVFERLQIAGASPREWLVECLGAGACRPQGNDPDAEGRLQETVLRIAVADDLREVLDRFARELMPLVTAGPQGITGYAEGRPRVHPMVRFWPCVIDRERVSAKVEVIEPRCITSLPARELAMNTTMARTSGSVRVAEAARGAGLGANERSPRRLGDIACARSGDKGIHANIGVVARSPDAFPQLCREVTPERVASYFGIEPGRVVRYELSNLGALNLVVHGILNPLRNDAQGKALGQVLLEMPLEGRAEEGVR